MCLPKFYYIISEDDEKKAIENAIIACMSGCKLLQLRMKNADYENFLITAKTIKKICKYHQVLFIINDNPHICKASDADGLHIGKEDVSIEEARNIIGKNKIIGSTANTLNDIINVLSKNIDYIGLGPYRYTQTKEKLNPILGIDGIKQIISSLKKEGILNKPIYAIGGITIDDIEMLSFTGIYGICISSYISQSLNPVKTIIEVINKVEKHFSYNENKT